MSIDWNSYIYRCPTHRCASYKVYQKHWGIDQENKKSPIPKLIWKDYHTSWDRCYYWFKDKHDRIGVKYWNFK